MQFKILALALGVHFQLFAQLPNGFSYLHTFSKDIKTELRYCSYNNFVGKPIEGYNADVIIITTATAKALVNVQKELKEQGLSLKIYDAYRPQQAVNHFIRWAKDLNDTLMKQQFYPNVKKKNLFKEEYIASRSGHSRGSTVDVTIVDLQSHTELNMGSPYDFFGKESWITNKDLNTKQIANRTLLQDVMKKHGFRNYPKEWWHFTLRFEPFSKTYFNFTVE